MANILTFNQVIDVLQDIAQRHYQINTFYLGRDWELENDNDIVYPVLQVYPEFARMPQTNGDFKTINVRLICKVVDLVNQNESNEKDVHSDTLRIAQDIVNEINQHPYYQRSNANIIGDIDFTNLEEYEDDFAGGWEFTLNLQLINNNSYCGLPFEELPGYSASGPVSSGYSYSVQYLRCDTLTACTSFQDYIADAVSQIPSQSSNQYWISGDSGSYSIMALNDSGLASNGDYSYAEGFKNISGGFASHTEGSENNAKGDFSHSEGFRNISIGVASHTEGSENNAKGDNSHAGGFNSYSEGRTSFIHSDSSFALGNNSVVLGGVGLSGFSDNTVYVPYLNIRDLNNTLPIKNLGIDIDGNIVGVSTTDIKVTGFTYDNANKFTIFNDDGSFYPATINTVTSLYTNYFDFNTGATVSLQPGRVAWNDTDGTLDVRLKGNNVTLQVGQEQLARIVNKTGDVLLESKYQVVYITGATGQRMSVKLAQANSELTSATSLGVVTENINKNAEGFITTSGRVREINTTGSPQGETWNDGDMLYLSPTVAGGITNIRPTAPNHTVVIGYVEYAHSVHGTIFIKIDNGYELNELHNVLITGTTKGGSVLEYSKTLGVWIPTPIVWTIDLMSSNSVDMYAPFDMNIYSKTNILNSPTVTIYDDNILYNLGDNISIGSKITISGTTNGVINLGVEKI